MKKFTWTRIDGTEYTEFEGYRFAFNQHGIRPQWDLYLLARGDRGNGTCIASFKPELHGASPRTKAEGFLREYFS